MGGSESDRYRISIYNREVVADGRVVRQGVTCFFKISSLRASGRVGGSESDRCRIQPSTIGQWWQMGEWSGRELLVF